MSLQFSKFYRCINLCVRTDSKCLLCVNSVFSIYLKYGHCEIRTHDFFTKVLVFKTSAIDQTRPNTLKVNKLHHLSLLRSPHPSLCGGSVRAVGTAG